MFTRWASFDLLTSITLLSFEFYRFIEASQKLSFSVWDEAILDGQYQAGYGGFIDLV